LNDDGSILATVTNAQGNVSYNWSAPSVGNNNPATGLSGGTYSVTVTDDSSCVATEDTILIFIPLPTITLGPFPDICENYPTNIDLRPFATPSGGVFQGNGVSGFNFSAITAGAGIQNIAYIISDAKGCKDTLISTLLVKSISNSTLNEEICELDSFTVGTSVFKNSGTFTVTLSNSIGCDSIISLNLIVHPLPDTTLAPISECEGRTVTLPDGTKFTSDGTHDITLNNLFSCDSVVRYVVTFIPTVRKTVDTAICIGDVLTFGTQNLSTGGTYTETFNSFRNCDSIVTLNLSINPLPALTVINVQGCEGKNVTLFDGTVFSVDGFKDFIYPNYQKCDSTVRYDVKFVSVIKVSISDTICANQTFTLGTQTLNSSGIYSEQFVSYLGCDSIVTLSLKVNPLPSLFNIILTPCEGDTATLIDGSIITTNTVKDIIIPNFQGCDSTIRYTINFIPPIRTNKDTSICEGQTFTFGTQNISSAGNFTETFTAFSGCDSIVSLKLSIISLKIAIDQPIICADTSAKISFTSTGVQNISWYKDNIKLSPSTNSITVNSAGNYYAVARQGTACFDTTNSITLTVKPLPVINLGSNKIICEGDTTSFDATFPGATYIWSNNKTSPIITEKTSGNYSVVVTFNACEFRDTATLTVRPLPIVNLGPDINACIDSSVTLSPGNIPGNYIWNDGSKGKTLIVTDNGNYSLIINDGLCENSDSINVVFDQTIASFELGPDTIVCLNTFITIGAQPSNADSYSWNTGATTPFIDVTETATYQLISTNQCGIFVDTVHVERDNCNCGVFVPNAFTPNGDGLNELALPIVTCLLQNYSFSVFNRWGEKVFESNEIGQGWDGNYKNQKQPTDNYIFYLKYQLVDSNQSEEQHGNIVLIR
jgi:gliding motility-associated-like protein